MFLYWYNFVIFYLWLYNDRIYRHYFYKEYKHKMTKILWSIITENQVGFNEKIVNQDSFTWTDHFEFLRIIFLFEKFRVYDLPI